MVFYGAIYYIISEIIVRLYYLKVISQLFACSHPL